MLVGSGRVRLLRRGALAGLALALALAAGPVSVRAQTSSSADEVTSSQTDAVTSEILQDPYLQLRFIALSMESEDEQGTALNGLVQAMLVQDDIERALLELALIEDPLWYARSAVMIADQHVQFNETDSAVTLLSDAVERLRPRAAEEVGTRVLEGIAARFAALGQLDAAVAAARTIPDPRSRVAALSGAAAAIREAGDGAAQAERDAASILGEAVSDAMSLPPANPETGGLMIDLGLEQARSGATEQAAQTFTIARDVIAEGPETVRDVALARLGAALVSVGQRVAGMQAVRDIPEGPERAVAISGIARAMAVAGDIDSAKPLFTLATELAENVDPEEDPDGRERAYSAVIADMAGVGLLLDAFTTAGQLTDRLRQSRALLGMARELLGQEQFDDALKLVEYIPYISMRAQIFAAVARARGEAGETLEASALLARALEPTGFDIQSQFMPEALRSVLQAQLDHGAPESDEAVFARAKELAETIPDPLLQVRALTRLGVAEGRRGFLERAERTLASAYRVAYINRDGSLFGEALADITGAQLEVGDLVEAFDTAARIPGPTAREARETLPDGRFRHAKWRALTAVAATAASVGRLPLGRRAANQIDHPPARAAAFAAMAVALADPSRVPDPKGELVGQ